MTLTRNLIFLDLNLFLEGEYSCRLFLAEEAKTFKHAETFSDISDVSDSILEQIDIQIEDLNDSVTLLNGINSNVLIMLVL